MIYETRSYFYLSCKHGLIPQATLRALSRSNFLFKFNFRILCIFWHIPDHLLWDIGIDKIFCFTISKGTFGPSEFPFFHVLYRFFVDSESWPKNLSQSTIKISLRSRISRWFQRSNPQGHAFLSLEVLYLQPNCNPSSIWKPQRFVARAKRRHGHDRNFGTYGLPPWNLSKFSTTWSIFKILPFQKHWLVSLQILSARFALIWTHLVVSLRRIKHVNSIKI